MYQSFNNYVPLLVNTTDTHTYTYIGAFIN